MIASVRGVPDLFFFFLLCVLWLFPLLFDGAGWLPCVFMSSHYMAQVRT